MDTDAGSDANDGTTWALAVLTFEGLLAVMAAGDIGVIQGATTDTAAATRTFTSPGTISNPCKILGVKDGTTNEGVSITTSDLVVRGTDTLPKIESTGATSDLIFDSGYSSFYGLHFDCGDQINNSAKTFKHTFTDCKFTTTDDLIISGANMEMVWVNCEWEPEVTGVDIYCTGGASLRIYGGSMAATVSPGSLLRAAAWNVEFYGFDLTNLGDNKIQSPTTGASQNKFMNCKTPATFTKMGATPTGSRAGVLMIGCNSASTKGATTSYQDYYSGDAFGTVITESTIVRTGGASDGASGLFSYAMTPHIDATLEGSSATLKSPWMNVWLAGGANTVTVYIANDTAATDFNQDEVWVEFYTPDAGDTAQHDQNFDPANTRLLESATIITDDTGSTWGTGGNNHQKMSATVTTGFEGWAYARLHFAKRYAATPATLYLDPKIAVT